RSTPRSPSGAGTSTRPRRPAGAAQNCSGMAILCRSRRRWLDQTPSSRAKPPACPERSRGGGAVEGPPLADAATRTGPSTPLRSGRDDDDGGGRMDDPARPCLQCGPEEAAQHRQMGGFAMKKFLFGLAAAAIVASAPALAQKKGGTLTVGLELDIPGF